MAIEPIKIPQNVYIEDHIIGPLTLKQVLICAIGGGFSYVLYALMTKAYGVLAIPIVILDWSPAVLAIAFAFVRVNDLSMMRLCLLLLEKMNKPTIRTWTPRRGIIINLRTFHTVSEQQDQHSGNVVDAKAQEKMDELSTVLDLQPIEKILLSQTEKSPPQDLNESFADEPLDEKEVALEEENPNMRRPVTPSRIIASPVIGTAVDGIAPKKGSISLFRTPSPAH